MEEEKKTKFVKDVIVTLTAIEVEMNQNEPDEINRIRFKTIEKGDITWKPKTKLEEFRYGLKVISKVPVILSQMPKKLKEMGDILQKNPDLKIKVNYTVMQGEQDGEIKIYRFITSEKTFKDWIIQEKPGDEIIKCDDDLE